MVFNFKIPQQPGGSYAYSQFSASKENSLYIAITDASGKETKIPLVAFTANFSLNEIPQATCTVGIGRDTASDGGLALAPIHKIFTWQRMQPAKIYFYPSGNSTKDTPWPANPFVVFDGYVTAVRRIKSLGKYQVELSLVHWLFDLSCSSAVSGNSHVSNPGDLTEAAIYTSGATSTAYAGDAIGTAQPIFQSLVSSDFWGALKTVFSAFAQQKNKPINKITGCLDSVFPKNNARALSALSRIEGVELAAGGLGPTSKAYKFASPLQFDFQDLSATIITGLTNAINNELIRTYSESSFWTKLISHFCPAFGLAVVPMIDSALVVADVPIFTSENNEPYKIIKAEDYDNETAAGFMERPLAGVVVASSSVSATGIDLSAQNDNSTIVGCYATPVVDPDGVVLYVGSPPWLNFIPKKEQQAANPGGSGSVNTIRDIFNKYAKDVYVRNALRGRTQTLSGRLRFDIAPGSIVRVVTSKESVPLDLFGVVDRKLNDNLAFDTYGQVARVSVFINTEAPAAGTSFLLTNVRTKEEYFYVSKGYGVTSPSIFTKESVHGNGLHGAPLSSEF